MSPRREFVAIYESTILRGYCQKIIRDPLKIELLPLLPREYVAGDFGELTIPTDQKETSLRPSQVTLAPVRQYIVLTARAPAGDLLAARLVCEEQVDRGMAVLAARLGTQIVARLLYRGWIASSAGGPSDGWLRFADPVTVPVAGLDEEFDRISGYIEADPERRRRFALMARFFAKALPLAAGEEKFLFLWTVLEVFPMKDTTDIRPISEFLAARLARSVEHVKAALGIGRLCGMRSDLVHHGALGVAIGDLGEVVQRLETIAAEVMRGYAGVPYTGVLERYFERQSGGL